MPFSSVTLGVTRMRIGLKGGVMSSGQPGILASVPRLARYLNFSLKSGLEPAQVIHSLSGLADEAKIVVGFGQSLVLALGGNIVP